MRGSLSSPMAVSLKAPTLRNTSISAAERSLAGRRFAEGVAAVVRGRLPASAARAAAYHLLMERFSAVVLPGMGSGLSVESAWARSVMIFPIMSRQELAGVYAGGIMWANRH